MLILWRCLLSLHKPLRTPVAIMGDWCRIVFLMQCFNSQRELWMHKDKQKTRRFPSQWPHRLGDGLATIKLSICATVYLCMRHRRYRRWRVAGQYGMLHSSLQQCGCFSAETRRPAAPQFRPFAMTSVSLILLQELMPPSLSWAQRSSSSA